jgi:hypothetical protein
MLTNKSSFIHPSKIKSRSGEDGVHGQDHHKQNQNQNHAHHGQDIFKGGVEALKDAVYNMVAGREAFTETTRKITM